MCCRFADGNEIDYHAFLAGVNWVEHPTPPVMPEDNLRVSVRNDINSYQTRRDERRKREKLFK